MVRRHGRLLGHRRGHLRLPRVAVHEQGGAAGGQAEGKGVTVLPLCLFSMQANANPYCGIEFSGISVNEIVGYLVSKEANLLSLPIYTTGRTHKPEVHKIWYSFESCFENFASRLQSTHVFSDASQKCGLTSDSLSRHMQPPPVLTEETGK